MKRVLLGLMVAVMLLLSFPAATSASPAYNGITSYVQPDQTVIKFRLMGDEHFNWRETLEGDVILLDQNSKYYCYGQLKNNKIVRAAERVGVDKKPFARLTRKNLLSLADYALRNNITIGGLNPYISLAPTTGNDSTVLGGGSTLLAPINLAPEQKVLVVLVEFNNIQMSQSDAYWSGTFFSETGKSIHNYYNEVSRGTLSFEPAGESYADAGIGGAVNDGVVRVRLNINHPAMTGFVSTDGMWDAINAAAISAIETASSYIPDISAYDTNGNGMLERTELHIVTIFAGFEKSSNTTDLNAIWAHAMNYGASGTGNLSDGLKIEGYMAVGERMTWNPITIGVFCHELGHSLGLPDLYDYGNDSMGLGPHSLMAAGSWGAAYGEPYGTTPVHLDAWSKIQLGFVVPTNITGSGTYGLNAQSATDYNVLKIGNGLPGQYFLVERRTQAGFDAGLDFYGINSGVAIYHIDENVITYSNKYLDGLINENEFRKAVDLEEANQAYLKYSELDTDPYYWDGRHYYTANTGFNTFGAATNPSSGLYDKTITSPFASDPTNGTQAVPSGVDVKVTSVTDTAATLSITAPAPAFHASSVSNKTYTGQPIQPTLVVHDGTRYLQQGVDYSLSYRNNVLPGKATIYITGIGNHTGMTGLTNFVIVPKSLTTLTLQLNEKYSVTGYRYRTIKASWPAVTGASGYYLAYRAAASSTWSTVLVTGTSWTKTLSAGTQYYVKVKPYVITDGTKRNYSTYYSPEKYQYTLKAPGISLAKYGTRSIKVTLGSVIGENGYDVRRASSLNGTYYHRAYVKANSAYWIDSSTYVGKTYYYKVRAYKVVNGVTIYGPYSTIKYIRR
jgi:M6 family metalloprotease-like protein